jgi:hypothetical protein
MTGVRSRAAVGCAVVALMAGLTACGGDDAATTTGADASSTAAAAEASPADVAARLQDAGYETGEVITNGANMAVAQNGKLDAEAYLSVDSDPEGNRVYAGIYFFDTPAHAAILAKEQGADAEQVDSRVYLISGTEAELQPIIAAAEGQ